MKRIIVAGAVSALAAVSLAGPANAAPANPVPGTPQCFGQIHKLINTEGFEGFETVGELVKVAGGQGKNQTAKNLCTPPVAE
jgi:hypothetical protein